jgi:hypothetical protein
MTMEQLGLPDPDAPNGSTTTTTTTTTKPKRGSKSRSSGWGRILRGNRVIWVMALVAVVALLAGLGLGRLIVSPGQAAADAEAPTAGLITVPVESRVLANDVTIRGDATYADSVDVTLETGDIGGPAVVTGQVPEVGATLSAAQIGLEITGRPVIVMPGDLPVYRTLRVGLSGPDVLQLKQSLQAVGINPGDVASDTYDAATASAVSALYDRIGYPAPSTAEDAAAQVSAANDSVAAAKQAVADAQAALAAAGAGLSEPDRIEQDNLVRAAQRAVAAAKAEEKAAKNGDGPPPVVSVPDAEDALRLAYARRDAAVAPKDTSAETAGVAAANARLEAANAELADAQQTTLTSLPASEVLFLPGLPRRVDEISVSRGSTISGTVMRVSGATLVISGSAAESDAALIKVGDVASLAMPDDSTLNATVTSVAPADAAGSGSGGTDGTGGETDGGSDSGTPGAGAGRFTVLLTPDPMTPEQLAAVQGTNVRVSLPVESTAGEVLAVPLAALTAGAGAESRVEVATGTGADAETTLVEVTTGLAADGYVEVSAVDGTLDVGDLVVVGR